MAGFNPATQCDRVSGRKGLVIARGRALLDGRLKGGHDEIG
jgi:hypothetical protein